MRKNFFVAPMLLTALAAACLTCADAAAAAPGDTPLVSRASASTAAAPALAASKIVLVGDSTTAVQGGWGPSFCAQHVSLVSELPQSGARRPQHVQLPCRRFVGHRVA